MASKSVTITFNATAPGSTGDYEWTTIASEDENFNDTNKLFTITSNQPTVIVSVPTVTLTVTKVVNNDNGGTATANDFTLLLTPQDATSSQTVSNGQANFLDPGNYTISENTDNSPNGYSQTGISCTDGETTTTDGNVALSEQTAWVCTITNDDIAPKLTLVKEVDNNYSELTVGISTPDLWTLTATGSTTISGISGSDSITNASVHTGTYTLSESGGPNGYTAGNWSCEGVQNDGNEITLSLGQNATCTITNIAQPAHLTIIKKTDELSGNGTFNFSISGTDTEFSNSVSLSTEGDTATLDIINLPAGSFDINETDIPDGWHLVNVSCVYDDQSVGNKIEGGEHITVGNGDDVTCTFTNTTQGTLIVKKVVINDNGGVATANNFSFSVNGGEPITFSQTGENDLTVATGTYSVTEASADGYTTTYNNCSDIELAAGETATCTITNNDVGPTQGGGDEGTTTGRRHIC